MRSCDNLHANYAGWKLVSLGFVPESSVASKLHKNLTYFWSKVNWKHSTRHILGHEGKGTMFSENGKTKLKKWQMYTKNKQKIHTFFTIFEKGTLMHVAIKCMEGLQHTLPVREYQQKFLRATFFPQKITLWLSSGYSENSWQLLVLFWNTAASSMNFTMWF